MDEDKVDQEQIVRAELHLFQKNFPIPSGHHYHVHIYYLIRAQDMESPLQLTFNHVSSARGWKTFDITQIAESWKQNGWVNYGLTVKLTGKGGEVLPCDGVFADEKEDTMDTEPALVVYTHDHDSKFFEGLLKKEEKLLNHVTTQQRRKRRNTKVENVSCHRKKLIVKKESLSSGNMKLTLPSEFDAGSCEGHCKRIEQSRSGTLSYASVMSLHYLHNGGVEAAPSRCCVPTGYNHIKLMLFVNPITQERILKKNVPVLVRQCGCL